MNLRSRSVRAVLAAAPIILVYFTFSIVIGISAKIAGLSLGLAVVMSVLMFGGSSQMVVIPLLVDGSPVITTVLTLLLMNLRLSIWSIALAPYISKWKKLAKFLFGSEITDETFALHATQWKQKGVVMAPALATNVVCHFAHCLGTTVGYVAGSTIPDVKAVGLDFVLAPMFIALLVLQLNSWRGALIALISGVLVLVFHEIGWASVAIIVATLIASFAGLAFPGGK